MKVNISTLLATIKLKEFYSLLISDIKPIYDNKGYCNLEVVYDLLSIFDEEVYYSKSYKQDIRTYSELEEKIETFKLVASNDELIESELYNLLVNFKSNLNGVRDLRQFNDAEFTLLSEYILSSTFVGAVQYVANSQKQLKQIINRYKAFELYNYSNATEASRVAGVSLSVFYSWIKEYNKVEQHVTK